MKRITMTTVGALALAGMAIAAQAPQTPPTTAPMTQKMGKAVIIAGCIKTWNGTAAGAATTAPPSSTAGSTPAQYVLTDAATAGMKSPAETPGAQPSSRGMHDSYLLVSQGSDIDLGRHLNHKVEVTGTVAPGMKPMTPPAAGATPPHGAAKGMPDQKNLRTLTVSTLKMVSTSCD